MNRNCDCLGIGISPPLIMAWLVARPLGLTNSGFLFFPARGRQNGGRSAPSPPSPPPSSSLIAVGAFALSNDADPFEGGTTYTARLCYC